MNKLSYLFIVLLVTQSYCQEDVIITTESQWSLESVLLEDHKLLEGLWDVQALFSLNDLSLPKSLYFQQLKLSNIESKLEVTYSYFNPETLEKFEEIITLTPDENDKGLFYFDLEGRSDWFRVVYNERLENLILMDQSVIEVGEMGEMGETEFEKEIPLESFENLEGLEGEIIDVGSGEIRRLIEGDVLIAEVHLRDWHLLFCITRNFDGVYDLRRFLRENEIKYIINKNYHQFPIVQKFNYPIPENFQKPNLEGDWRLLAVYETEEFGRLFPWDLSYCPKITLDISDPSVIKVDFKLDLFYGGSISRIWTIFPREDQLGVVIGFVGDRPIPIGVVDLKDDGLLVVTTNEGTSFLIGTPSWTGSDLTQDDINYFRGILNDKIKLDVSDFYLYLFYSDECIA